MQIYHILLGPLAVNCYIIASENGSAAVIDPGGNCGRLKALLIEKNLKLEKILLTHGHYDHFGGAADALNDTDAELFIHTADAPMLTDPRLSLADEISPEPFKPVGKFTTINDGDTITLNELSFKVIHTPGHTKGGVCYVCKDVIFTGDTLFALSMGRTDFPGGDPSELHRSLMRLAKIKDDLKVLPGHNNTSTLGFEKRNNPYMKENPYEDFI